MLLENIDKEISKEYVSEYLAFKNHVVDTVGKQYMIYAGDKLFYITELLIKDLMIKMMYLKSKVIEDVINNYAKLLPKSRLEDKESYLKICYMVDPELIGIDELEKEIISSLKYKIDVLVQFATDNGEFARMNKFCDKFAVKAIEIESKWLGKNVDLFD
jgi:hypothetical protein